MYGQNSEEAGAPLLPRACALLLLSGCYLLEWEQSRDLLVGTGGEAGRVPHLTGNALAIGQRWNESQASV